MGRKKPKRQKATPLRFTVGDQVRVKRGVMDYDFPDIPIGGWAGTVKEIYQGQPPHYLIRWSQQTVDSIHPIYKKGDRNRQLVEDYCYWFWNSR